jgi:hypothetical protein
MTRTGTPHAGTDKKWFDELVLELRLRRVYGSAIGDTVASARELLADTGQSAEEAFGPARGYAGSLDLQQAPQNEWVRTALWPLLGSLLAFLIFTQAGSAWAQGQMLLFSVAQVALLATPVVLLAFLPLYLTAAVRHIWLLVVVVGICALSGFFASVVAPESVADAWISVHPVPWMIGTALVMVALATVYSLRSVRPGSGDLISDPLATTPSKVGIGERLGTVLTNWLFPLLALCMWGFTSLLR